MRSKPSNQKTLLRAGRRASKLVSLVVSCFTGRYVALWPEAFPARPLRRPPMFDGRAVCYPTDAALRDYLAWRQVDTHVNNQARCPLFPTMLGHRSTSLVGSATAASGPVYGCNDLHRRSGLQWADAVY